MLGSKRYHVKFRKSARKEFLRLPTRIQDRIVEALSFLAENPFTDLLQVKELRGSERLYRIRLGDCRVVYTVESFELVVIVVKIGHRRERTARGDRNGAKRAALP
jgi:mRNA interferase RelE/StbE